MRLAAIVSLLFMSLTPSAYNVYSPEMVIQNNQQVMYFGGWMSVSDIPTDAIYRMPCQTSTNCGTPVKVISPVLPLVQINDPALVQMSAGYWIMYMTGSTSLGGELSAQGIYFATSWDGVTWSPPQLLMSDFWLPTATVKDGSVYLVATPTSGAAALHRFDLGASGVGVGVPVQLSMPDTGYNFINADIVYHPSIGLWQMVAENLDFDNASTFIDYLYSWDGLTWYMGQSHIIESEAGGSVRTPSMHPSTAYYVYFGCSDTRDGMGNQVCFKDWSP